MVIIAAELLKNADELVKQKIHPTSIIAGYRLACKEAVRYIQDNLTLKVFKRNKVFDKIYQPPPFPRLMTSVTSV